MGDINTLKDLLAATVEAANRTGTTPWWRGQARVEWKLIPSVFRPPRTHNDERNMALRFISRAHTRRVSCPADNDAAGWLALMQHYRLPTRLLDWSELPLVALYFAVVDNLDVDGALWVLDPFALNKNVLGQPVLPGRAGPEVRDLLAGAFSSKHAPRRTSLALTPWETDLRMLVQGAAFTVHDSADPLDELSASDGALTMHRIPASAKRGLLQHLAVLGVRRSVLFPDLENLAAELRENTYSALEGDH